MNRSQVCRRNPSHRRGFTLIELVVVLVILAILAGLVVSIVGWVRRSANYASSSNSQSALMANLELYRTTFGNGAYPNRFDSLLTTSGTVPTYVNSELSAMITPGTFADSEEYDSVSRSFPQVLDHADTLTGIDNPGNSATTTRTLSASSTMAFANTSNTNVQKLMRAIGYVDNTGTPTLPANTRLLLVGIGPLNTANGKTMQSPPFDTNVDTSTQYNRFIAVFTVYTPRVGQRTQLKAVLCPRGRVVNANLSEYYQSTNPD